MLLLFMCMHIKSSSTPVPAYKKTRPRSNLGIKRVPFLGVARKGTQTPKKRNKGLLSSVLLLFMFLNPKP